MPDLGQTRDRVRSIPLFGERKKGHWRTRRHKEYGRGRLLAPRRNGCRSRPAGYNAGQSRQRGSREQTMTAIRGYVAPTTETGALGVHSLDQFVLAVPDANVAQEFYGNFGLDLARDGNTLAIKTFGHEHRWGSVVEGKTKALHHLSFGRYAEDLPRLKARIEGSGVKLIDPPPGFESNGFWFRNHENVLIEVKVGPKVSPSQKSDSQWTSAPAGTAGAAIRQKWPPVRPRRLSHVLIFTADVDASIKFYELSLIHISEPTRLGMISYAVFCLKKKK